MTDPLRIAELEAELREARAAVTAAYERLRSAQASIRDASVRCETALNDCRRAVHMAREAEFELRLLAYPQKGETP